MTAITATKARENIYQLIQDVNASSTPVTITNTRGKNAVLIGEEDWKAIEEMLYLMSIPGMAESIIEEEIGIFLNVLMSQRWNGNVQDYLYQTGC